MPGYTKRRNKVRKKLLENYLVWPTVRAGGLQYYSDPTRYLVYDPDRYEWGTDTHPKIIERAIQSGRVNQNDYNRLWQHNSEFFTAAGGKKLSRGEARDYVASILGPTIPIKEYHSPQNAKYSRPYSEQNRMRNRSTSIDKGKIVFHPERSKQRENLNKALHGLKFAEKQQVRTVAKKEIRSLRRALLKVAKSRGLISLGGAAILGALALKEGKTGV